MRLSLYFSNLKFFVNISFHLINNTHSVALTFPEAWNPTLPHIFYASKSRHFIAVWHFTSHKSFFLAFRLPLSCFPPIPMWMHAPAQLSTRARLVLPCPSARLSRGSRQRETEANSVVWIKCRAEDEEEEEGRSDWCQGGKRAGDGRDRMVEAGMRGLMWIFPDRLKSPLSWPSPCWEPRLPDVCEGWEGEFRGGGISRGHEVRSGKRCAYRHRYGRHR